MNVVSVAQPARTVEAGAATGVPAPRRRRSHAGPVAVFATQVALIVGFVTVWQWGVSAGWINSFFFGAPVEIYATLRDWTLDGSLLTNTGITLAEAAIGFLLAIVLAVPIGIGLARSPFWGRVFSPFIDVANSTPRFALAPLFVLFFGLGLLTKVALVFSVAFFVMLINTIAGASSVDPNHIRFARLVGVTRWQLLSKVILPATANWLIAGMRLSAPYSIAAAVVGEMISSTQGLGYLIVKYAGLLETSKVLAAVLFLAIGGWLLNMALTWLFKRLPWAT
jgi:NitT/TauT family transport system permease protein